MALQSSTGVTDTCQELVILMRTAMHMGDTEMVNAFAEYLQVEAVPLDWCFSAFIITIEEVIADDFIHVY